MQAFQIEKQIRKKLLEYIDWFLAKTATEKLLDPFLHWENERGKFVPSAIKKQNQPIPCMLSFLKAEKRTFTLLLLFGVSKVLQSWKRIIFCLQHKDTAYIPGLSHNVMLNCGGKETVLCFNNK